MFGPRVKLDRELYERLRRCAEAGGYSSTEEFILHVLEQAAAAAEDADSPDEISKRLKGLGYLD